MKSGTVITFANQKGGVAKTTSSVATAAGLTARGKSVLLIDVDPQCNSTDYTIAEFFKSKGNLFDVINGRCDLLAAIEYDTEFGDILPSSPRLYEVNALADNPFIIKELIDRVRLNYDYIIIDTPPTLGMILIASILATDYIVIPTKATKESIKGVGDLIGTIGDYTEHNPNIKVAGFLVTMSSARVLAVKHVCKELHEFAEQIGCKVFDHHIRTAEGLFGEAELFHDNIFTKKQKNNAVKDYDGFIDELLEVIGCQETLVH